MGDFRGVDLVGMHGGTWYGATAGRALAEADVIVGARRHLDALGGTGATRVEMGPDLAALLDHIEHRQSQGQKVCVLVSGDPGFFGLLRLARARLGSGAVRAHPAPTSVALAFARAGTCWDDAVVVSAHGRPAGPAVKAVLHHPKVAVLCSPDNPPEELGRRLLSAASAPRMVTVAARLEEAEEEVWAGTLDDLAAGRFDPLSVAIFEAPGPPGGPAWRWGRPESDFEHRAGMITKAEVRAVALGKLGLPAAGVMWDIGAGSGSVSSECAGLAPGLRIFAVERRGADLPTLRRNLARTAVTTVEGEAPAVLEGLPDPDRVFVGGGGVEVLDAALARLRPEGTIVATFASPDRASKAAARLGHMVQISVNRAVPVGPTPIREGGALRLAAENPVFVCWGP